MISYCIAIGKHDKMLILYICVKEDIYIHTFHKEVIDF